MTPQQVTAAARWLRQQAARVAVERADLHLHRQRQQARARVADQPRDRLGRWCRQEGTDA